MSEVSFHEAGHAIAAWALCQSIGSVSLDGDGGGGEFRLAPSVGMRAVSVADESQAHTALCVGWRRDRQKTGDHAVPWWVIDSLTVTVAGILADRSMSDNEAESDHRTSIDRERAIELARTVTMSERAAFRLLDIAAYRARRILHERRDQLEAIARELDRRRHLDGDDVHAILGGMRRRANK
jgi:hypothetical protein